jgi:hypothetical protein
MPTLKDIVTQSLTRRLSGVKPPAQAQNIIAGVLEDLGDAADQLVSDHIQAVSSAAAEAETLARVSACLAPVRFDGQPSPDYLRLGAAVKNARTEFELRKVAPTGIPWRTPWF